jgi:hypothetical protein
MPALVAGIHDFLLTALQRRGWPDLSGDDEDVRWVERCESHRAAERFVDGFRFALPIPRAKVLMMFTWWSAIGLVLDLAGVLMLGFDLIRVQQMLRAQAADDLARFDEMAESYGGTESWIAEIKKSARWVPESSYSDYHAQDEVSFNAEHAVEKLKEAVECMEGLAQHLAEVASLQRHQAEGNREAARTSLRYSIIGLVFIFFGFLFQMFGTLHITLLVTG